MATQKHQEMVQKVVESFAALHRMLEPRKVAYLAKFHLSRQQADILYLVKHAGGLTIKQLAEATRNSSSATTQLVEGLVKMGFLDRVIGAKDRRTVRITLSENGKKKFFQFKKMHVRHMTQLFNKLSPHELSQLGLILEKIIKK